MFYLPPQETWYHSVTKLDVTFDNGSKGSGTGFFVYDEGQYYVATARHVVDPKYLPPSLSRASVCTELEMSFSSAINPGSDHVALGYQKFRVSDPEFSFDPSNCDLAVLKVPKNVLPIRKKGETRRPISFKFGFLATDEELGSRIAGEPVVFVGYPDNAPVNRTDGGQYIYPILRQGVFAYPPIHGIDVEGELGRNYGLIDSFAQSGFSGGPVISLQKGWADGSWHTKEHYRRPSIVGLICGHYRSGKDRADGTHAGLSFFLRADSIRELIEQMQNKANRSDEGAT